MKKKSSILPSLSDNLPLLTILVAITLAWGTLYTKVDTNDQTQVENKQHLADVDIKLDDIKDTQGIMKEDIAVIKQVLKANELLTKNSSIIASSVYTSPDQMADSSAIVDPPILLASAQTYQPAQEEAKKKEDERSRESRKRVIQETIARLITYLFNI